jgi:integrase
MAGLSKRGNTYYVTWRDSHGIVRRRSTGCKDKSAAETVKRQVEKELLIDRTDPFAKWRRIPLTQHAMDYRDYQLSIGTSERQVIQIFARICRTIDESGIRNTCEITVSKVTTTIDGMRMVPHSPNRKAETYPPLSLRTKNFYAKAMKQLTRWMVCERRLEHDPLLHVPMRKVDTDLRHNRRALSDDEFAKLFTAAERSDNSVEGIAGPDRAFLYLMARLTGLRRSELASLTAESFLFVSEPMIIVEAAYSKHRERDVVPLHPDLLPLIRERIKSLPNGNPLFPGLKQRKTAKMMRFDLEAAGIPYKDKDNRFADFHALRHTFITKAWETEASADVVMSLARHRSLQMTIRYTHVDRTAQNRAMQSMRSPLEDGQE